MILRRPWGGRGAARLGCVVGIAVLALARASFGVSLENEYGEFRLGLRTYAGVRVATQKTDFHETARVLSQTFPTSPAGHLRQMRHFLEVAFDHDLDGPLRHRRGPFAWIDSVPFRVSGLAYNVVFRSEYEGIYDFGAAEYRTGEQNKDFTEPILGRPVSPEVVGKQRRRLRDVAVYRARLFQAYVEADLGDLFVRFGRQNLVWGETDAFRLLDNINPIDPSFGGFLIPLDERRVPLDMLRLNYNVGTTGPFSQLFVEGFVAIDNSVAFNPGVPIGSPWALPNSIPTGLIKVVTRAPAANFENARFGAQAKFNVATKALGDITLGLAHYYTFVDVPGVNNQVVRGVIPGFPGVWPDDDTAGYPPGPEGALLKAVATAPRVQITGATSTFVIPSRYARRIGFGGEPVIRTELAYFHGEPRFRQSELDPLEIASSPECLAAAVGSICDFGRRTGDSWNVVLGVDTNQYIRFLNPRQSFLISTQFFYKHLVDAAKRRSIPEVTQLTGIVDGEVIPVPEEIFKQSIRIGFVHNPVDQYLQTLLVATSYRGGTINPALLMVYDWYGAFAFLPQISLLRDPFRMTLGYSFIEATRLRGASGVSLLRDRDNVSFQVEYVL